ncbi:TPM domain-containing protein [Herbaspirillum sp. SJZ099]|uniref:TPM domain-containing protein n=1 Tax=Herbaspirillum sp. SJZ099 TaxID=2572916 RepID=UPI00119D5BD7|nr:TPM domain-containing protein [Herbaspirillum sp. SJZ099]TWC67515.1 TLP18.3/Psb32/MOLO-1 phosphatase superfamily protein [Herbaspirillum sp. SJZ099]
MSKDKKQASVAGRMLRHLAFTHAAARRAFPSATLKAIQASIAAGERQHRAQVRVIVEASLSLGAVWRHETSRQRAHELFARYRIWDTEENCGVLAYINLADHKVEIVADRGVSRLVTRQQWQQVCAAMTAGYARGDYHDSTLQALAMLHDVLAHAMPHSDGEAKGGNELSDKPLLL